MTRTAIKPTPYAQVREQFSKELQAARTAKINSELTVYSLCARWEQHAAVWRDVKFESFLKANRVSVSTYNQFKHATTRFSVEEIGRVTLPGAVKMIDICARNKATAKLNKMFTMVVSTLSEKNWVVDPHFHAVMRAVDQVAKQLGMKVPVKAKKINTHKAFMNQAVDALCKAMRAQPAHKHEIIKDALAKLNASGFPLPVDIQTVLIND